MKFSKAFIALCVLVFLFGGCKKNETAPKLIFKFKFDPTQERFDSFGQPADNLPAGHAGQNPSFNAMSAHYIELTPGPLTLVGQGVVLYKAPETTAGGSKAIDFSQSTFAKDGEMFFETPLSSVAAGDYQYLRVSLAYQNYDVRLTFDTVINYGGVNYPIHDSSYCTVASFIGYNTYVANNFKVKNQSISAPGNHLQGFWGFEYSANYYGYQNNLLADGQATGAITVVNPISSTSPIQPGSCLVTGAFSGSKLHISGAETKDIVITVSLSTKKSFEWIENGTPNGKWEPTKGEQIVDMGIRGMIPSAQY